jgi:hypothetical protein
VQVRVGRSGPALFASGRLSNIFPICSRYRVQRSAPTFSPASLARRELACP